MPQLRQKNNSNTKGSRLTHGEPLFRIAFEVPLDNGFELKDMNQTHIKEFHRFLAETVYKNLSISEVDALFLRTRGFTKAHAIKRGDFELVHYGKDRNPFRIFGYYNSNNYVLQYSRR